MSAWTPVVIAAGGILTAAAVPLLERPAVAFGLVSRPGGLNPEARPVPLVGGIALLLGGLPFLVTTRREALGPLLVAFLTGMVDDVRPVPAPIRASLWAACGAGWAAVVHAPLGGVLVAAAFTLVVCTGVNFLDGIDGIAGAVTLGCCAGVAGMVVSSRPVAASLAAGSVAFLVWNRKPARCYLGNSGSSLVGVWIAVSLLPPAAGAGAFPWLRAACVAVPTVEVGATAARRWRDRLGLLGRERGHGYDRLVARGWPVGAVAAGFGLLQLTVSALGVLAYRGILPLLSAVASIALLLGASVVCSGALGGPRRRMGEAGRACR